MLSCFSRVWLCATLCYGPQPTRLLCPWDSSGKNTRVGCHALLQGIFLTQGSNPGLLHRRWVFTIWATKEAQQRLQSYPRQVTKAMVVTNTSSPRSFSKAAFISASNPVPALFIPSSFPRPHYTVHLRILCTEHPVFFFTICPQALPLVPADADTRRPLASGVAGDPGAQSFKLFDLSTQDLRGCSPTKIKFIWPWKFGLDWHDREERFFFFSREWKSTDKTSEANVSKHFQPTCSFRISADQQKAKVSTALDARLKNVLFCPTGQRSYECFEVRVVTWSKCFRKIN